MNFLTTSKTDFFRRLKHADFERLYAPIREEFKAWLADLGVKPAEITGTEEAAILERELRKLLDDVPELGQFFGFRTRKDVLRPSVGGTTVADIHDGIQTTFPSGEGEAGVGPGPVDIGEEPGEAFVEDKERGSQTATPISRTAKRGPKISVSDQNDRPELAWVEGNNVIVNVYHPSYLRTSDVKAKKLHSKFAVASAIQRWLVESEQDKPDSKALQFIDRLMAEWGKR